MALSTKRCRLYCGRIVYEARPYTNETMSYSQTGETPTSLVNVEETKSMKAQLRQMLCQGWRLAALWKSHMPNGPGNVCACESDEVGLTIHHDHLVRHINGCELLMQPSDEVYEHFEAPAYYWLLRWNSVHSRYQTFHGARIVSHFVQSAFSRNSDWK